ncbi:MAG: 2-amino-4-hydroxy-6-hydroxymethyldihydropteridine diphosphokinase [Ferrimonas sp.]
MTEIFISLGSNIDAERHIRLGLTSLAETLGTLRLSPVYESEAVGFAGDNFLNLVVAAQTDKPIAALVALFKRIEQQHGRPPGAAKFAPRTLDIDLLLYGDACCQTPVVLPRPEIGTHAFVLLPLQQLWPTGQLHGRTFSELWAAFPQASQPLWAIDFQWDDAHLRNKD